MFWYFHRLDPQHQLICTQPHAPNPKIIINNASDISMQESTLNKNNSQQLSLMIIICTFQVRKKAPFGIIVVQQGLLLAESFPLFFCSTNFSQHLRSAVATEQQPNAFAQPTQLGKKVTHLQRQ